MSIGKKENKGINYIIIIINIQGNYDNNESISD